MKTITMLALLAGLLLPGAVLALDAETQALERAALCQAMPYRVECGGAPPAQPVRTKPAPPANELTRMEEVCEIYAGTLENAAKGRDAGLPMTQVLRLLRRTSVADVAPSYQTALEQGLLWVYTDIWLTPARVRQQAEVQCLRGLDHLKTRY